MKSSREPKCIRQALLNKGGIDDLNLHFDVVECTYYSDKELKIRCVGSKNIESIIIDFGKE